MSRPLRLELAGGLYHVTSCGDRREDIYHDDTDRLAWLAIFAQTCERFNWHIHAWCQMSNHYHLIVETIEGNLSAGMRHLNGVYTQTINRRHRRTGHVLQGRYKGILVERDSYLLELSRYVMLNPIRAKMVKHVRQWKWSSYHAMTGTEPAPPWLQTDWVLGQFGHLRAQQVARYVEFVQEGVRGPEVWQQLKGQIYLGADAFVGAMSKQVESDTKLGSREIPRSQRRALAKSLTYYRDEFEDHYSTVSRAIGGK